MRRFLGKRALWFAPGVAALLGVLAWALFWIEVVPPEPSGERDEVVGAHYDALLARIVDAHGRVDYDRLLRERAALDAYVAWVAIAPLDWEDLGDRDLAFLVNAYNAWVLYGVLQDAPPRDVEEHKLEFFLRRRFRIAGRWIPLHWLEHRVIRANYDEPRVHFALNCASQGCPPLLNRRYDRYRLEQDLAAAEARTLDDARYVRWAGDELQVSALFEWFAEDFEPSPEAYLRRARPGWPWSERTQLSFLPWDGSLNRAEQGPANPKASESGSPD